MDLIGLVLVLQVSIVLLHRIPDFSTIFLGFNRIKTYNAAVCQVGIDSSLCIKKHSQVLVSVTAIKDFFI